MPESTDQTQPEETAPEASTEQSTAPAENSEPQTSETQTSETQASEQTAAPETSETQEPETLSTAQPEPEVARLSKQVALRTGLPPTSREVTEAVKAGIELSNLDPALAFALVVLGRR